jgi:hypothetical protein
LDATQLTCDQVYLDFDIKLLPVNNTGAEYLRVVIDRGTEADTLSTLSNTLNFNWHHYHLWLYPVAGQIFRLKFICYGKYSDNIYEWLIDNISVTRQCKPPSNLQVLNSGQCGNSSCFALLTWKPPVCETNLEQLDFIYDDGSAENGLGSGPGAIWWIGNRFPISPDLNGYLTSFDIWFWYNPDRGNEKLTLDVFDENQNYVGSSEPFSVPDNAWVNVNVAHIPFSGKFYAMVKWNALIYNSNYIGVDCNGPWVPLDLACMFDGTEWYYGLAYCYLNCMLRAHAIVQANNTKSIPADTTTLLGYNIYKEEGSGSSDYLKINDSPVTDTTYTDTLNCSASYYVTALYNTGESMHTDTLAAGCFVGIPKPGKAEQFKLYPNPSEGFITLSGIPEGFNGILKVFSLEGRILYSTDIHDGSYDFTFLNTGTYLVTLQGTKDSSHCKLIILK